ncbi:MAG TPA: TonB-dependent receptor plug domain-containing protein [Spirochaetales bacterium]|nr:TonB-dependent receptor plug domain-containing protein [Spirochaetales bacterium]
MRILRNRERRDTPQNPTPITQHLSPNTSFLLFSAFLVLFLCGFVSWGAAEPTEPTEPVEGTGSGVEEDFEDTLLMEGEGLTFTSTVETSQQIQRIDAEEIRRLNPQDTVALLEKAFNLNVTRNGSYGSVSGISLRGYGSGRVAVLIDGVPVNSAQNGTFDLGRISPESIEEIEVIYGGSDTKFNFTGAQGGVVNIITNRWKPEGKRIEAEVSNQFYLPESYVNQSGDEEYPPLSSLLDTQKARVLYQANTGPWNRKFSIEGTRAENQFLYEDDQEQVRRQSGAGVQDVRGDLSILWDPKEERRVLFNGSFYGGAKEVPGPMYSTNPGDQDDVYVNGSLLYGREGLWGNQGDMEAVLSYAYEGTDWKDATGTTTHDLHTGTFINRWNLRASDQLLFRASGDVTLVYLDSSNLDTRWDAQGGAAVTGEFSPRMDFLVVPSIKLVVAEDTVFPVPKLGLVYTASEVVTLKNNWFRTFRLPTLNDRYWPEDSFAKGNPDLKPEDGVGTDFMVEYRARGALVFQGSLYAAYQRDAISWQVSGGKWSPENIAEAAYFGSDIRIESDFHPNVRISGSYSWLLTYVLTDDLTFSDDKRMPYAPVHTLGMGVEVLWESGSLSVSQQYRSERYTTPVNAAPLDPYFTLDVDLVQSLGAPWTLFVSAKNALGSSYQLVEGYPMPRTTLSMGVRYTWEEKPNQDSRSAGR